jgi:adenosine deaminase
MIKVFKVVEHAGHAPLPLEILKQVPKIELHAHLSCSLTRESFKRLLKRKNIDDDLSFVDNAPSNEVFFQEVFPKLLKCIENKSDLKYVTEEVLSNFEDDGVRFGEFRSNAKNLSDGTSQFEYVETILEVIDQWKGTEASRALGRPPIDARYTISLNRSYPQEHFLEVIRQVKRDPKWAQYITGLDFSGDPYTRDVKDYLKCFDLAREAGLKLTIHTAELPFHAKETRDILSLNPERLGHFIYYTEEDFLIVKERGIHIEACPTSNFVTSPHIATLAHPLSEMYTRGLSLSVCTDDQLLFGKSLSEEIKMVTDAFGYGMAFVEKTCGDALDAAFINDDGLKARIADDMRMFFKKV